MHNVSEEWRPAVGFEGYYSVSTLGRVRRDFATKHHPTPGILAPRAHDRYVRVLVSRGDGRRFCRSVHVLVAEAFLGPRPDGFHINHRDGDKTNNRLTNLEYATPLQNGRHAVRTGLHDVKGGRNPKAKLSVDQVRAIRALRGRLPARCIAERFGVHACTVERILSGRRWAHVT